MITANNYYNQINKIGVNQLPPTLLKSHELVDKITQQGASWETYNANSTIKRVVDLYLSKLNEYAEQQPKAQPKQEPQKARVKVSKPAKQTKTPRVKKEKIAKPKKVDTAKPVEMIEEEIRFIKRFVSLNGKTKTPEQVLNFLNSLQKAIVERRIRKTSPYANEIKLIQEKLVQVYNNMGTSIQIHLKPETMEKMIKLVKSEKVMPSINFIKRYVRLQGKTDVKDKAKKLLEDMKKAVQKGILTKSDKYAEKVNSMYVNLHEFVFKSKESKELPITKAELNGLMGILNQCGCNGLDGLDSDFTPRNRVMSSLDFARLRFDSLGFKGKWRDFIGDPAKGFTAMVFGRPKMGKSYLCIDFAGYLARNHGKVLYVAKEEKLDATLQKKLNDTNVKHPNLFVSDFLPENLSQYDFVFIDSVNKMELQPSDLDALKAKNPSVSFIYVFQTTKEGNFRGSNHFQHDVDVVIEIPEKGLAIQNGRFNQGGEMGVF